SHGAGWLDGYPLRQLPKTRAERVRSREKFVYLIIIRTADAPNASEMYQLLLIRDQPLVTAHDSLAAADRSTSRNGRSRVLIHASSRSVQAQSQQAQGSEPSRSRQRCRPWASCTRTSSKYSSQYGTSSHKGVSQKQTSTQRTDPSRRNRAAVMLRRYSSPATEPAPRDWSSIASSSAASRPCLTRAVTR